MSRVVLCLFVVAAACACAVAGEPSFKKQVNVDADHTRNVTHQIVHQIKHKTKSAAAHVAGAAKAAADGLHHLFTHFKHALHNKEDHVRKTVADHIAPKASN